MNRRLFIDMDGTLAKWNNVPSEEVLYEKGYYSNLEPNRDLIKEVKRLIKDGEDIFILSSFLNNSNYALSEKNEWLNRYLPEIPPSKRIFVNYGENKALNVPNGITSNDYLIDDYTKNLLSWKEAGGIGIKFLNGINHTKGTWKGLIIDNRKNLAEDLEQILNFPEQANDEFNNQLHELYLKLLNSIYIYQQLINKDLNKFLNAEVEMKKAKMDFIHERDRLKNIYDIEVVSTWKEGEELAIHYKISFKDGKTLYEGYNYIESLEQKYSEDELINEILSFNVKNKTQISKISPELKYLVDSVLATDTEINIQIDIEDLLEDWKVPKEYLYKKLNTLKSQLKELGLENCVKFNTNTNYFKNLGQIIVDPSIITEFEFSNNETLKKISKEENDLEYDMMEK